MNRILNRRTLVKSGVVSSGVAVVYGTRGYGQESTPSVHEHAFQPSRPMPEFTVTISDTDLVFPPEVAAGLNRVTFENQSAGDAHLLTTRLPDDVDLDELMSVLADEEAPMPDYLRSQYFPGIPDYPSVGGSSVGVINYEPGTYLSANIFGMQMPSIFAAVGDPWGVSPPMADHQVGMVEMAFLGLEEPVATGPQVWSLVNFGVTWHEILLLGMPGMMTPDELLEFILTAESINDLASSGYFQAGASGILSPGSQMWLELDLESGAYGALCLAPDDFSGPPHAFAGMITTFEVQ